MPAFVPTSGLPLTPSTFAPTESKNAATEPTGNNVAEPNEELNVRPLSPETRMAAVYAYLCGTCRQFRCLQFQIQKAVRHCTTRTSEKPAEPAEQLSSESRSRLHNLVVSAANRDNTPGGDSPAK